MPGKSEIAERIAARGWSKAAATTAVDAVLDEITSALAAGERVTLTGFGTFEAASRAARTARNPRTGVSIDVPATTVARFHPGAGLRSSVASGSSTAPGALAAAPHGALATSAAVASPAATAAVVATPAVTKAVAVPAAKPAAKKAESKKAESKKAESTKHDKKKHDDKKHDKKKHDGKKKDGKKHKK